jgi:hypothetical protein
MGRFKLDNRAPVYERPSPPGRGNGSGLMFFLFSTGMVVGAAMVLLVNDQSGTAQRVLDLIQAAR